MTPHLHRRARTGRPPGRVAARRRDVLGAVRDGLWAVVNEPGGTAYRSARLPGVDIAGKTGTVQVVAPGPAHRPNDSSPSSTATTPGSPPSRRSTTRGSWSSSSSSTAATAPDGRARSRRPSMQSYFGDRSPVPSRSPEERRSLRRLSSRRLGAAPLGAAARRHRPASPCTAPAPRCRRLPPAPGRSGWGSGSCLLLVVVRASTTTCCSTSRWCSTSRHHPPSSPCSSSASRRGGAAQLAPASAASAVPALRVRQAGDRRCSSPAIWPGLNRACSSCGRSDGASRSSRCPWCSSPSSRTWAARRCTAAGRRHAAGGRRPDAPAGHRGADRLALGARRSGSSA